jgi:hypothetical protein
MFCRSCGKESQVAGAKHCGHCGRPFDWQPVQRQGKDLVVFRGGSLPPYCVKCGMVAHQQPVQRKFYWHSPLLYLTILAGVVVYAIVALIVRKRFDLGVPLCEPHFRLRRIWMSVSAAGMLIAFPALIVGVTNGYPGTGLLVCLVTLVGGAITWAAVSPILRPTKITDELAVFRGAHESFFGRLRRLDVAETFA